MNNTHYEWPFALFSAHLHHFLPNVPWKEHETLYRLFDKFHRPTPMGALRIEPDENRQALLELAPSILCLYHLGTHYETVLALGNIGLSFDLLLDRDVYLRNETIFSDVRSRLKLNGVEYRFLFSDDRSVLLKVRTALGEGRHVVVFADGNSGAQTTGKSPRTPVCFFNGVLCVKQGIAMISHILQTSVIPLWLKAYGTGYSFFVAEPIDPCFWPSREEFIEVCMQSLYDRLADQIIHEPWKWECWSYIHLNGSFDPAISGHGLLPEDREPSPPTNKEAWITVEFQGNPVYFDRINYSVIL